MLTEQLSRIAHKWNFETEEYEFYRLPDNCPIIVNLSEEGLNREINCASCAEPSIFARCYTSRQIHNSNGFGYPVCEECYQKEWENERNAKFKRATE